MLNLETIHHIALIASDYEKSRHFYVDLLGFRVIRENYRAQRNDYKLDLQLGSCELELFGIPGSPARPGYPEACGLRHLAFKVACIEDTIAELKKRGIETEPVRIDEFTDKKMTFFKDPDGLPLELHE
jgi:glyoxylase I family protein